MISIDYEGFLDKVFQLLGKLQIDTTDFKIDHIAYQVSSSEEFDKMLADSMSFAQVVRIPVVNGRRVGVLQLKETLYYKEDSFEAFEIIEPVEGKIEKSRLEHVEFLTSFTLEEILSRYEDLNWDTSSMNREEFPHLKIRLNDEIQVKFPRGGII